MFKKTILANGLRIITAPVEGTKTATVLVMIGTGGKYETRETSGISHFLEHLFFKGTKKRPSRSIIAEDLEKIGSDYNAFTSKEYTGFYAKTATFQLDRTMDIISDILLKPLFPAKEIEKERGVILEEIKMIKDDPPRYIGDVFEILLYGDTPAGWDFGGTPESVSKITRAQILEYFRSQYVAKNIVVCVAGAINSAEVLKKIKKYFGGFDGGDYRRKEPVKEFQSKPQISIYHKKTDQTHISLGVRAYDVVHPNKYALMLLGLILGGGMSSRLYTSIVDKRGLAYYVFSGSDLYTDSGYFTTQAGISAENLEHTIGIILSEYKNIAAKGVSDRELKKVKDYVKGRMVMSMESSSSMASFFADQEILTGEILTAEEKFSLIDKVKASDIKRVAKDIFKNEKLNLALIGPFEKKDEDRILKILKI